MIITYHGHSSFKLRGKIGTVITDPFSSEIGFEFPNVSGDVVTISHDHEDHNQAALVSGTARRKEPFVIDMPGEYEVGDISIFGVRAYHDGQTGEERGSNNIFTTFLDGLRICHLGDLGHELEPELVSQIGLVDILLCPVGGIYTVGPKKAIKVIKALEPSLVVPMHYKTPLHNEKTFGELATVNDFLNEYGVEVEPEEKLNISSSKLPEETEIVVLERS